MSPYIFESTLAYHYGWDLDKIRALELKDFYAHLKVCLSRELAEKEFKALLAGAVPGGQAPKGKFLDRVPNKGQKSGAIREQQTENVMKFSGKVRPVRIK